MKYRKLGTTDLNVSVICLGTMTWGEQNNQQEGFDQMNYALERGINFFDTAELLGNGLKKLIKGTKLFLQVRLLPKQREI